MKTYRIKDKKGFYFGGKHRTKGEEFDATGSRDATVAAGLHFRQIEEVTDTHGDPDPDESDELEVSGPARKLAEEHNVDLSKVTGTGSNGAITKPDVEAFIAANK